LGKENVCIEKAEECGLVKVLEEQVMDSTTSKKTFQQMTYILDTYFPFLFGCFVLNLKRRNGLTYASFAYESEDSHILDVIFQCCYVYIRNYNKKWIRNVNIRKDLFYDTLYWK